MLLRRIFDGHDFIKLFLKVADWTVITLLPATYLMDPISYVFFPKVYFKYLKAKFWAYRTGLHK